MDAIVLADAGAAVGPNAGECADAAVGPNVGERADAAVGPNVGERADAAISPAVLARVSGVSPAALDAVSSSPGCAASLARADAAESAAAALAEPLEAALFALVPSLSGDARRAALQLKRDVHNGRTPRDVVGVPWLDEREPAPAGVSSWLAAVRERDAAVAEAAALLADELAGAERAVVARLRDPDIADGLALASPDFALQLVSLPLDARAGAHTRLGRSCVAYLSRSAVKTSPFSTLTTLALTGFERALAPTGLDAEPSPPARRLLPARALALELLDACAQHPRLAAAFRYAPADWRWGDGVLVPRHLCSDGFFHRTERVADASGYRASLRVLDSVGVAGHAEYVASLGGHAAFRRLVAMRLLRPVAPWQADADDRLDALADALSGVDPDAVAHVREIARAFTAAARPGNPSAATARPALRSPAHTALAPSAPTARPAAPRPATTVRPGAEMRVRALAAARHSATEALTAFGASAPPWLRSAALAHEDVAAAHPVPPLGAGVRADLERLAAQLRPRLLRTHFYDRLVDHFRARYGAGATCPDVVDFLSSFMARRDLARTVRESMAQDAAAIATPGGPRTHAPVGPSSAVPAASVFFSLAAAGPDRRLLVPSHLNPGLGGLLARTSTVLETGPALREWMRTVHPDARAVELPAAGDWSALHAGRAGLERLRWPGDTPTGERELRLSDLALTHDRELDTLTLHDRTGRPVAPVYLGVAPPHMIRGPLRLLLTLADPWVAGHRFGFERGPWDPAPAPPHGVEHEPRVCDGRVVMRRARWRVAPGEFPLLARGESALEFLRRVGRWQRAHSLPAEVFMTVERRRFALAAGRRKPTWLAWDSLHALAAAGHRLDDDVVAVNLVEALPGRDEHVALGADSLPRAVEYVALLAWPETSAAPRIALGAAA